MGWGGRLEAGIRADCVDEKSLRGIFSRGKCLELGTRSTAQ